MRSITLPIETEFKIGEINMTDDSDLVAKRKETYAYIKATICTNRNIPKNPTDIELADALGGTPGLTASLRGLKEGTQDPNKILVSAFKREFGKEILESTIDARLVDPFK